MIINYNIEKISSALDDFYNVTGVNISLRRADLTQIPIFTGTRKGPRFCAEIMNSKCGHDACRCSDLRLVEKCAQSKHAEWHICHAGLTDIAVPISVEDEIIGYIILGQMRNDADFSQIEEHLCAFDLPLEKMREYYSELEYFDSDKTQSVINVAVMLAKYILLEDMMGPRHSENIEKATEYINQHLTEELSIQSISAGSNVSKSVLYRDFRKYLNCTVGEYVSVLRVERATVLLAEDELTVEKISEAVGFSSASYFSKTFKRIKEISPVKYRNLHRKR